MENNQDLLKQIQSDQPTIVAEAIRYFQENGDLQMAQMVLEHLPQIPQSHTKTTLLNLLADIKENAFKKILIQTIQTTTDTTAKTDLLRIVWESSLNYSEYLSTFLDLMLNEDFQVAFEASTVIENMLHNLTQEQHNQLHQFICSFPADRIFLIENLDSEIHE